ncbi:MAG: ABC transporter permease [Gemmatimonadaceae bacterium]|nr:ABC transporter permease [Gemmatimonadaceae bacterium]
MPGIATGARVTDVPGEHSPTTSRLQAVTAHILFSARTAIDAVRHNKLRAGLTSLGILFGVASVIAMLAIGNGAEQEILQQMKLLGANNIVVTPIVDQTEGKVDDKSGRKESRRFTPGLTYLDALAIARTIPDVAAASSEIVVNSVITREGHNRSGKLVGVDSSYFGVMNLHLAEGARFSGSHYEHARPVAIIGPGVKARFFTTENPIGHAVKVGTQWLTVVGVLEDRKVSTETAKRLGIRDANMDVFVPLPSMLLRYRNRGEVTQHEMEVAAREGNSAQDSSETDEQRAEKRNYHQLDKIVVQVTSSQNVSSVAEVTRRMLQRRHNDVTDFEISVPELLLKQEQRTKTIFNVVLGAIASISLIVGGIGIMNIMLASILERIKEIGVRRAMGATQRDILAQFLSEAVMISLAGGVAGIVVGVALSLGIERAAGINTIVSFLSVALAFGVSVAVGLVFGIVPARNAAKQDVIVCLRYE